ncbi:hypothetical protein [Halalkalibacillus halophilus]|uniref:hypothetical protein n=1 Tax=Halalkalibacillus halophilus TaxID=392827 RepID=UPI00042257C9|nr:hypothetical protein [Halalkalibacillus halophilus]
MGYIPPVHQNHYSQYHRRVIGETKPTISLDRTFRTELEGRLRKRREELEDERKQLIERRKQYKSVQDDSDDTDQNNQNSKKQSELKQHLYTPEEIDAFKSRHQKVRKQTGKGRHFSESI